MCVRNTTAGITAWRVNNSNTAVSPSEIAGAFPGHTNNGVNIVIVNATNNTEYVCVSLVDGMQPEDSAPVLLYVAGMFIILVNLSCVL